MEAPWCSSGFCDATGHEDAGHEEAYFGREAGHDAYSGPSLMQGKRPRLHNTFATTGPLSVAQMQTTALQMSELLQKVTGRSAGPTKELFHSFRICGQCKQFERFGEWADGGYLTCMDGLRGSLRAAYSIGVEQHDKWSHDVTRKLGVPVSQFDCTVNQGTGCKNCKFFNKCITSEDNHEDSKFPLEKLWTLREALENSGQADAPKGSLLLKMDIEGSEWPVCEGTKLDVLAKFRQIIVEFHSLDNVEKHQQYLATMQKLLGAGFQVTHLHGNNCCGMVESEEADIWIPNLLEVTFVQEAAKRQECLNFQEYLPQDHMNGPGAELPFAKLD